MTHAIIIFVTFVLLIIVFYYTNDLKDGFANLPNTHNNYINESAKKFNPIANTLNLVNPVIPLTPANASLVKNAFNSVDLDPSSENYNVTSGAQPYDIPSDTPNLFKTAKQCESAPVSCSAFDDATFANNCGMSFDTQGTDSDGKEFLGGLFVSPNSRESQQTNSAKARDLRQDPYLVFQPSIGTAKPGTFSLTKDDCIIVKEKIDCEKKQTFDSPNCTQCYTSRDFSRVGPEAQKIPIKLYLQGYGRYRVQGINNPKEDPQRWTQPFPSNAPAEFIIDQAEGHRFLLIAEPPENVNNDTKLYMSGYIEGNTPKGTFKLDLLHLAETDVLVMKKPRISGTVKINGFQCARIIPQKNNYGWQIIAINCQIPFSFIATNDYEAGSCANGPVITKADSAIFLNSDACFNKDNKPGNYSLECLQSRWLAMGGTSEGTGYPSDKAKADGLQKNPDGSPLPIETIIDNLSVMMLRAQTGRNAAGKSLSIQDWNISSMFATGRQITSPCDTEDADSGPLSQECLSYLYMNQGNTSHIGSSYDSPAWLDASMKGQPERNTFCQPGTSLDPNTAEGLKLGQTLGGVEQAKNYYNRINRIANDDSRPNKEREKEIKQCFGVSLNPVVNNATPGPKQVFAVGPGYDYTRDQAAQVCAGYGAQVATKAQLAEAQSNGADWCFCGWVQDSAGGQFPITTSVVPGCGGRQGIIDWTPDDKKVGVNCYGPKPAINAISEGTVKPFNGTSWDQPSNPGYTEVPSGYLQTSGAQPSCFSGLSPEQAKDGCNRLGDACAGISYSKDGAGHGCYKGDQRGGLVNDPAYMGFVKTPLPSGNNQPYKTGNWQQIPGSLKQVSHDGNVVCGVNGYDDIYCKDNLNGGNWFQVPGKLKHVSVSNGKLYGANSNDDIWYNDNFRSANWRQIPGKLKQVDIDGNTVCGVNSGDAIYCKDNLEDSNWFQVPGGLKHVAVSNGKLYGTNSGDAIYYNDNFRSANWRQIPGGLKQVDIDGNTVCGVNSGDDIYCKDNLEDSNWFKVDGNLKYVSINNDKLYGVNSGNGIFAKI